MFNFSVLKIIFIENFYLVLFALFINIGITYLRTLRFKQFVKIKNIKGLLLFLSFYRVANFTLPFKSADIIQLFFFKKILIKNKIFNILSLLTLTKVFDMFGVQLIASIIFIIFILNVLNQFIFGVLLILIFTLVLRYKKKIIILIKKIKKKLINLKHINKLLSQFLNELVYLSKKDLLKKSIIISILNYFFIFLILYLSTDQTIDREIFFLVFIFTLLQPLPIKLFFGVGFFDFAVYVSNIYFGVGIDINQLLTFRILILSMLVIELFLMGVYYFLNLIYDFSKKYNQG